MCRIRYITVLCWAFLILTACASPPTREPPAPTPTTTTTEEVVKGQSGEKRGEVTPIPGLPAKDRGEELPKINEEGGEKRVPEEVPVLEPGTTFERGVEDAKPPPDKIEGEPGEGPKKPPEPLEERANYAQIQFRMTPESIEPVHITVLEGELIPSTTIDGEFIYVVSGDGRPKHVGSFRDPLVAVGLPMEPKQGYSLSRMEEGYFSILIPGELVTRDQLPAMTVEFFRLDPTVPLDTSLTVDAAPELLKRSEGVAKVGGRQLFEFLEQSQ
jgi:hypothetical protein